MKSNFDEMFKDYSESDGNIWGMNWRNTHKKRIENVIKITKSITKGRKISVLETACATGDMTYDILNNLNNINNYDACDISKVAIDICKNNPKLDNVNFFIEDISNLKVKNKYDFIFCIDVLYYLSKFNKIKAIDNIVSILNDNGYVLIAIPYYKKDFDEINYALSNNSKIDIRSILYNYNQIWTCIEAFILKRYEKCKNDKIKYWLRLIITNKSLMEFIYTINCLFFRNLKCHAYFIIKK